MSSYLKQLIKDLLTSIYAKGKFFYEEKGIENLRKLCIIEDSARLHTNADIINLSKSKTNIIIGKNTQIYGSIFVYPYSGKVTIGDNCSLGELSRIVSSEDILIGNRVLIAHNVNIFDNNSHPKDANLRHEDFINNYTLGIKKYDLNSKKIIIEDDVWIGFNSIILKGLTIGEGAIIGAGSVVTRNVPPWTINVGNPLRSIKQ